MLSTNFANADFGGSVNEWRTPPKNIRQAGQVRVKNSPKTG
jgi:hypothetical protein